MTCQMWSCVGFSTWQHHDGTQKAVDFMEFEIFWLGRFNLDYAFQLGTGPRRSKLIFLLTSIALPGQGSW